MSDRLPSTGRRPSMSPSRIQELLEAYYGEDSPSLMELCERFQVTNAQGESRNLSLATVRKYLKAAGVNLPRGKAAVKEREEGRKAPYSIRTMMNGIPTETLIGEGQVKLLCRFLERGDFSQKALASQFGISERRVRALRATLSVEETDETAPSETEVEVAEAVAVAANLPSVEVETFDVVASEESEQA